MRIYGFTGALGVIYPLYFDGVKGSQSNDAIQKPAIPWMHPISIGCGMVGAYPFYPF
jgi:hypothetical protein